MGETENITRAGRGSMIDPSYPLAELHRHLDGNVRLETILDIGLQKNLPLPARDLDGLRPFVQVVDPQPGVMAFISKFKWLVGVMVDYDSIYRIAYENVEDAQKDGIDYIELRFSPWFMAEPHALVPEGVVEAVIAGISDGQQAFGIKVNLVGILSRTYGAEVTKKELKALLTQPDRICALDLAGDETHFPVELFVEHFHRAREVGWHITAHAGEIAGSDSIWNAIRFLGAERIGHALRAIEDPGLLEYMAMNGIGVESCLTSNVQTSCVPDYASHPLKKFLELGIQASINTDDPGISGIDLSYEYNQAAPNAGLTSTQIQQAQHNALDTAFITFEEKEKLVKKKRQKSVVHDRGNYTN
jgi:adenosine deaminase